MLRAPTGGHTHTLQKHTDITSDIINGGLADIWIKAAALSVEAAIRPLANNNYYNGPIVGLEATKWFIAHDLHNCSERT